MKKIVFLLFAGIILPDLHAQKPVFLPLGDSYTICEGLGVEERWPNLLAQRMKNIQMPVDLPFNPSKTGYTTDDLIKHELGYVYKLQPQIVTVLIGVNDYVRGYDTAHFHKNLAYILNEVQSALKTKTNIILITIPDYSVTPAGKYYANGRDVAKDLQVWNGIIRKEALQRRISVVDIFPTTQKMKDDPSLVSGDELHPSAKEVAIWANLIEPEFTKLVKQYY